MFTTGRRDGTTFLAEQHQPLANSSAGETAKLITQLSRGEARPDTGQREVEANHGLQMQPARGSQQASHQESLYQSGSQQKAHSTPKSAGFQEGLTKDYKNRGRENAVTQRDERRGSDQSPEGVSQQRDQRTWPARGNPPGKRPGVNALTLYSPLPTVDLEGSLLTKFSRKLEDKEHILAVYKVTLEVRTG